MAKVSLLTGRKDCQEQPFTWNRKTCRKPNLQKLLFLSMVNLKRIWASARALKSSKVERV